MNRIPAFWDSSALIPICVQEQSSAYAHALYRQFSPVVWWATSIELHSAFARLLRMREIDETGRQRAFRRLAHLDFLWHEISPSEAIRDRAQELVSLYPLSAADGLQLAAALAWCRQRPARRNFLSGDARLCEAATAVGFIVIQL